MFRKAVNNIDLAGWFVQLVNEIGLKAAVEARILNLRTDLVSILDILLEKDKISRFI